MILLETQSYEDIEELPDEELPEEIRTEIHPKKFENLAVSQPQSPFFRTASAWVLISNADI